MSSWQSITGAVGASLSSVPYDYEDEPDEDEEPKTVHAPTTRSGSQANEGHRLQGRSRRVPLEAQG
jgi:hypothetical protein